MPRVHHTPESGESLHTLSLEQLLARDEQFLMALAEPAHPITAERLESLMPHSEAVIQQMRDTRVEWPDAGSAVFSRLDGKVGRFFSDDAVADDMHFAYEALAGLAKSEEQRGFNNFPAILRATPLLPDSDQDSVDVFNDDPVKALYGTKPYLHRAYAVAPEFMQALNQSARELGGMEKWNDVVILGGIEPSKYPKDAVITRASRIAYGLLANLMRTDDLQRQYDWLGFAVDAKPVTDPEAELWT